MAAAGTSNLVIDEQDADAVETEVEIAAVRRKHKKHQTVHSDRPLPNENEPETVAERNPNLTTISGTARWPCRYPQIIDVKNARHKCLVEWK